MLLEPAALRYYANFFDRSLDISETYPAYFRFVLRMVLDLQDLGMPGDQGTQIASFVRKSGFLDYETYDVRRLEILYLLDRGLGLVADELKVQEALVKSIARFISQPNFYTKSNKPLFYDLTHIVFFLTDYGTKVWSLDKSIVECLLNVGVLALLDQDTDLLAEVCICLNFLNETVPTLWIEHVRTQLAIIDIEFDQDVKSAMNNAVDDYHPYLVSNWLLALEKRSVFNDRFKGRKPNFVLKQVLGSSPLAEISKVMHDYKINRTVSAEDARKRLGALPSAHLDLISRCKDATSNANSLLDNYTFGLISS